jgi:2-iminobutanoate/2-iminopropanoate deaminase
MMRLRLSGTAALTACAALALAGSACTVTTSRAAEPARAVVAPPGSPTLAAYSPAIRAGGLLFLSGQIGLRPGSRELVAGGVAAETRQTLENVRLLLDAAGLGREDLVKCTVFLADIAEYEPMNAVYAEFFHGVAAPARSALGVSGLPLGARVEIECIAVMRAAD